MKFTNNMFFFSYMYACVNVILHFALGLVTMINYKKYTHVQIVQFFNLCALYT
jgi:hypothetical protein